MVKKFCNCPKCGEQVGVRSVGKHFRANHPEYAFRSRKSTKPGASRKYFCVECKQNIAHFEALVLHYDKIHFGTGAVRQQAYPCQVCGELIPNGKYKMAEHFVAEHPKYVFTRVKQGERSVATEYFCACGVKVAAFKGLVNHYSLVHGLHTDLDLRQTEARVMHEDIEAEREAKREAEPFFGQALLTPLDRQEMAESPRRYPLHAGSAEPHLITVDAAIYNSLMDELEERRELCKYWEGVHKKDVAQLKEKFETIDRLTLRLESETTNARAQRVQLA